MGKNELVRLLGERIKVNPNERLLEGLMNHDEIKREDSHEVLEAAYETNWLIIHACCTPECNTYKANGVWLKPKEELVKKLIKSPNLSHGYCPPCAENFREEIRKRQATYQQQNYC